MKWFGWIGYAFLFAILDEVSSFDSTNSLGYGTWGDICMKVFFLIEPVGAIFTSRRFHFHMDTYPIKNCQFHFWRKPDYYLGYKANSCIFFFLLRCPNQVTTGHKLLKIGENPQGHGESRYDHEEGSPLSCVHILNWCVFQLMQSFLFKLAVIWTVWILVTHYYFGISEK